MRLKSIVSLRWLKRLRDRLRGRAGKAGSQGGNGAQAQPYDRSLPVFEPKRVLADRAKVELVAFLAADETIEFAPPAKPEISIVIVMWNKAHLTLRCLQHLKKQKPENFEVVLVDNGSTDNTIELLKRLRGVRVVRSEKNEGFLLGANRGAAAATGRTVLHLNNDCFLRPGALAAALETLDSSPDIGAVGGRLVLLSNLLQEAGSIVWSDGSTIGYGRGLTPDAPEAMFRRDVDYCSGAFLLTKRSLWQELGGFDTAFQPAYFEEVDYCLRLWRMGQRVVYEPRAVIDHFEFGSEAASGDATALMIRNRNTMLKRHAERLSRHLPYTGSKLVAREFDPARRRRLLVVDDLVPLNSLGSGFPRVRELLSAALSLGWSVTFYSTHQSDLDWAETRREIPWEVEVVTRTWPSGPADFIQERAGFYHCVFVSRPNNLKMLKEALRIDSGLLGGARLVYDAEAVFALREIAEAEIEGKPVSQAEADRRIADEVALADGVDAVVCVTDAEANLFRTRRDPDKPVQVHVISHPTSIAGKPPHYEERRGFLFVGRLLEKRAPNWRGLAWFVTYCWPLIRAVMPQATLTIAGRVHSEHRELSGAGISFVGPQDDLTPFYNSARVFLAPVRFAAGVPIKILDATAAGLPSAGTRLMAKQMNWTPGMEMMAEDSPLSLATEAVKLHENRDVWETMLAAAQASLARIHSSKTFRDGVARVLEGEAPLR